MITTILVGLKEECLPNAVIFIGIYNISWEYSNIPEHSERVHSLTKDIQVQIWNKTNPKSTKQTNKQTPKLRPVVDILRIYLRLKVRSMLRSNKHVHIQEHSPLYSVTSKTGWILQDP